MYNFFFWHNASCVFWYAYKWFPSSKIMLTWKLCILLINKTNDVTHYYGCYHTVKLIFETLTNKYITYSSLFFSSPKYSSKLFTNSHHTLVFKTFKTTTFYHSVSTIQGHTEFVCNEISSPWSLPQHSMASLTSISLR